MRWLGVFLLVIGLTASVRGEATLQWKLKKGDQFFLEEKVLQKQTLKFMGADLKQDLAFTRVARFTVLEKAGGGYVLEQKILSVRPNQGTGSASAEAKLLKNLEGATFKVTLGPDLRVTKFEGYEDLLKKISPDAKVEKMVRALLPEETLSRATEALFAFLPEGPVKPGAEWALEQVRPLGPLGSLKIESTGRWLEPAKGDSKDLARIELVPKKSTYVRPRGNKDSVFEVIKGDIHLDTQKSRTAITFNMSLGRPVQTDRTTQLFGSLTVSSMGVKLNMDVEHEETVNARFLEKAPPAK